jgi:hypothetical protein
VSGEQPAQAWGLTRQALAPVAGRGEVFAVKVGNLTYTGRPTAKAVGSNQP